MSPRNSTARRLASGLVSRCRPSPSSIGIAIVSKKGRGRRHIGFWTRPCLYDLSVISLGNFRHWGYRVFTMSPLAVFRFSSRNQCARVELRRDVVKLARRLKPGGEPVAIRSISRRSRLAAHFRPFFGATAERRPRRNSMDRRIKLTDVDRPEEPLEVEVERVTETILRVQVPNTIIRFDLRRARDDAPFEGALGGRSFTFDPTPPRRTTTTRRK